MTESLRYEERYCLFLDILGFQSHVTDSITPQTDKWYGMNFRRLHSVLNRIREGVHYKETIEVEGEIKTTSRRVTQFSDSVVISYLKDESGGHGIYSFLMDVHRLQLDLAYSGVLLRGAVTSGLLFHDDRFVFGPALNDAVAYEKLANYPRVILDAEILEEARIKKTGRSRPSHEHSRTISSMVSEDFDGLYYVDYFNVHPDDFSEEWGSMCEYLECLRRLIKGLAHKKYPGIRVKHSWLRTKFNNMIEPLSKSGFREIAGRSVPDDERELFMQVKPF